MGHGGNMGHVDFTYFCDNSDNKGDHIKMITNIFFALRCIKEGMSKRVIWA